MHFHGIHPAEMDGVPEIGAGLIRLGDSTVYEFDAEPFGMHLYHCHAGPLAEHIARGMYGAFIVDPRQGREEADELLMTMNGFNTNFDAEGNQVYAVNSIAFHSVNEPIRVRRGELVRIHLAAILEYDPINSFHLHGNFFDFFPTGTRLEPADFTDTSVGWASSRSSDARSETHPRLGARCRPARAHPRRAAHPRRRHPRRAAGAARGGDRRRAHGPAPGGDGAHRAQHGPRRRDRRGRRSSTTPTSTTARPAPPSPAARRRPSPSTIPGRRTPRTW